MSDVLAKSGDGLHTGAAGEASSHHRPARAWLGRLSTCIASFAGGMAVNDVSGALGYHGLAGAVALSGVVTAAAWIRGLDPRARLPRYAPRLFLVPAGCAAAIAAFSSGSTLSILTALAAVLTVGAVLVAKELESAVRLLLGVALIALVAAPIAFGAALIAHREALVWVALIALGAALIAGGAALIAVGAVVIGPRSIVIRARRVVEWATKAPRS